MLISGNFALDEKTTLVPYGGIMAFLLRGNVDAQVEFTDANITADANVDVQEDEPIVLLLGTSLLFQECFSVRVEGRLIGDSSVSAGVSMVF